MASSTVLTADHKTFHLSESSAAQYIIAVVIGGGVYFGVVWYTRLASPDVTAAIINRGMSMGTLILLGLVLLMGPLSRIYGGVWHTLFMFRKELGVVAFVTGAAHVYLSMFVFARHGPFGFYTGRPLSAYTGLAALIIMAVLAVFSFHRTQKLLPPALWWKMQYLGARTAFFGVIVHIVALRNGSWLTWIQDSMGGAEASYPPLALLGTIFGLYILAVRIIDYSKSTAKSSTVAAVAFGFVAITAALFVPVIIHSWT